MHPIRSESSEQFRSNSACVQLNELASRCLVVVSVSADWVVLELELLERDGKVKSKFNSVKESMPQIAHNSSVLIGSTVFF